MLHYKTFQEFTIIYSPELTLNMRVCIHRFFTKITSFIPLNYSIKMQFTKKMDILIDE